MYHLIKYNKMENFNKYLFLDSLKATIINAINSGEITDTAEVQDFIAQEIDTACIYYSDCFEICKELNFTDWSDCEYGLITNITQAAYFALQGWIDQEICYNEFEDLIENEINNL